MKSDYEWTFLGEGSQARHLTGGDQPHCGRTEDMMERVSEARGEDMVRPAACLCDVCMVNSQTHVHHTCTDKLSNYGGKPSTPMDN